MHRGGFCFLICSGPQKHDGLRRRYALSVAKKASSSGSRSKAGGKSKAADADGGLQAAVEAPRAPSSGVVIPRPGKFADILGQPRAISTLSSAFASGRLHHAWIFHGPQGVGKFTTALAFAAAILDPTTEVSRADRLPTPDPQSTVQRLLASGSHPDLHVVVKELAKFSDDASTRAGKQITIAKDVVEAHLIRPAALAPAMSSGGMASKVFIVDEAELLDRSPYNAPTQNSILKTLEEPSPGNVIILVTSAEDRLLATIRSRCQRVAFGRLPQSSMNEWMRRSQTELPPEAAPWLLEYADGSPGDLLKALATGLWNWQQALAPMLADLERGRLSGDLGSAMAGLIEIEAQRLVKASPNVSKEASNKVAADVMFRLVGDHLRRGIRTAAGPPGAINSGREIPVRAMQARLKCLDLLGEAERQIDANVQAIFACSNLAAQMGVVMASVEN
jgi:DNA polymerase-3 subunit delta'